MSEKLLESNTSFITWATFTQGLLITYWITLEIVCKWMQWKHFHKWMNNYSTKVTIWTGTEK